MAIRSIPRCLTLKQVADRLCVSTKTVRRWADGGVFPVIRLPSGRLRVDERDLEAYLNRNKVRA